MSADSQIESPFCSAPKCSRLCASNSDYCEELHLQDEEDARLAAAKAKVDALARQVKESMTTQPPPESAELAPVCPECQSSERVYRRAVPFGAGYATCCNEWHRETAPVATDTQARECPIGVCCTGLGRVYCDCVCHNATPAPAGDAEVSQARLFTDEEHTELSGLAARLSRWCRKNYLFDKGLPEELHELEEFLHGRSFGKDGDAYVSLERRQRLEAEARQQQAEREVDGLRCALQGKDEAIAELTAERDFFDNERQKVAVAHDELSRKLEAAERELGKWRNLRLPTPPDQPPPAKPLTRDDVKTIARSVIAEVATLAVVACKPDESWAAMAKLAEAAKEQAGG